MDTIKNYKDLIAYKKAYQICIDIYNATKEFPKEELYVMVPQMRRSAISIPSNIAEGYRRNNLKEYIRFLKFALGSCAELETQVSLSRDLKLIKGNRGEDILKELEAEGQLLYKLILSLEKKL